VTPDAELIVKLVRVARADLGQCQLEGLQASWRLIIAYTSILNAATAALMAAGFRADRDQHHYRTLMSLEFTLGPDARTLRRLDGFRKKRHVSTYDRSDTVSDQEASEIATLAAELLHDIVTWLKTSHADLVGGGLEENEAP